MTLKARLFVYIVAIHVMVGAVLVWQRSVLGWWLFALEIALLISLAVGVRWIRIAFKPIEVSKALVEVIEAGEFGTRYPVVNQREIDRIIRAFNRMLEKLQQEWLRLGEQRGFLERFLDVTPIGIIIFDFSGRVSLVNPRARALLGLSDDDDPIGKSLADIESTLAADLATLVIEESRLITDANGRRLRCQRSQFTDRGFGRTYVLIEELTAELNLSERETYEKLIRMISHEVANTVAATNSLLESCRTYAVEIETGEHRADYENALDVLITRNHNLNEFTRGFSDLVKLPEPLCEETDIGDLLQAMQTMFAPELRARNIKLKVRPDADLPLLSLDRNQIDQALINVIKNAAEAIGSDGEIDIVARRDRDRVSVEISDTGGGLDAQARRNLFKPFFTTKKHGQGLGLTLVKEILSQHGFAFSLEPTDRGSCFRVEIPCIAPRSPEAKTRY